MSDGLFGGPWTILLGFVWSFVGSPAKQSVEFKVGSDKEELIVFNVVQIRIRTL